MSDSLGLASTAISLVNGVISLFKDVNETAKNSDDFDLKRGLSDLYSHVLELKAQLLDLAQENEGLRRMLNERESITWDSGSGLYIKRDDATPFCPVCFDRDKMQSHLRPSENPGWGHHCNVCGQSFRRLRS